MAEKKMNSIQKEIEKLEKSLDRYKGLLEKKVIKCENSTVIGQENRCLKRKTMVRCLKSSGQHGLTRALRRVM